MQAAHDSTARTPACITLWHEALLAAASWPEGQLQQLQAQLKEPELESRVLKMGLWMFRLRGWLSWVQAGSVSAPAGSCVAQQDATTSDSTLATAGLAHLFISHIVPRLPKGASLVVVGALRKRKVHILPNARFHVVSFFTEGRPHDAGLNLRPQHAKLRAELEPYCRFHGFSARQLRALRLVDGTTGERAVPAYPAVAGHPNAGLNAVGWGSFKPFVLLAVMERAAPGSVLLYVDSNVDKHWFLGAFGPLLHHTARWLLEVAGHEDVAMPRERASLTFAHTCSRAAIHGAEARCGGRRLAHLHSAQANRIAVRAGPRAALLLRLWLNATLRVEEMVPSAMLPGTHVKHTPEQCAFGLLDACRNGPSSVFFDPFFTRLHAKSTVPDAAEPSKKRWRSGARRAGRGGELHSGETLRVFMSRAPPNRIEIGTERGSVLARLAANPDWWGNRSWPRGRWVDACLAFPRTPKCASHALMYARHRDDETFVLRREVPRAASLALGGLGYSTSPL